MQMEGKGNQSVGSEGYDGREIHPLWAYIWDITLYINQLEANAWATHATSLPASPVAWGKGGKIE